MQTTMDDIARECGVSIMTVSRVLNGKPCVKAATREKILKSVARLKFETNALARNFAQKRSGFVGIAVPFGRLIGSNYFGEIFRGLQRVFDGTAWDFAMFDTLSPSFDTGGKLEKLYRSRRVDGLLIVAPDANDRFLDTLNAVGIPQVVVGKSVTNTQISAVTCDDYAGIQLACAHLYELGHRSIAFVGGPVGFSVAQRRERSFIDFCREKNLSLPPQFVQRGDYTTQSGYESAMALLGAEIRPTAFIAANDAMAYGVMGAAARLGMKIPGELSVVGFDDLPSPGAHFVPLTTVHQPILEIAAASAKLLLDTLNGSPLPAGIVTVPVSLVTRESTGPAPATAS